MKRVEFDPGFPVLRGKIAGPQILEYAENNNPAFEAPTGRQYARNYKAAVVSCKRSATGKMYFQIKTKSATKINAGSKLKMALLGGTGAVRAAILGNATHRSQLETIYAAAKAAGQTSAKTIQKFAYDVIYEALLSKSIMISFYGSGASTLNIQNPWVYTNQMGGQSITIKNYILVKFWPQLATKPINFVIDGLKGVAHEGDTFDTLINRRYNVLGITKATIDGNDYIKIGDSYVQILDTTDPEGDWDFVAAGDVVLDMNSGNEYRLTENAPE